MTVADVNALEGTSFVAAFGWVFEDSPWVAEQAWLRRPFGSRAALRDALAAEWRTAPRERQLASLRAHPDLGTRAKMSAASTGEQGTAGLDRLTPEMDETLVRLNARYRARFGYPFVLAVAGATAGQVLNALERRVDAPAESEWTEALDQVVRIAWHRIDTIVDP
jgi:2-oxo-4-hydroxy-4-carboxy-5-ureidoimidazoline decarboxylase